MANSNDLQPARTGSGNQDPLAGFGLLEWVGPGAIFSTGFGGSGSHVGDTFTAGQEGYIGFTLLGQYGWARVVFTANEPGAKVRDWAYNRAGGIIQAGGVEERVLGAELRETRVYAQAGDTQVLVSGITDRNGDAGSLRKTGEGTVRLDGAQVFSGATLVEGGTLALAAGASLPNTSSIHLAPGAVLDVSALASLNVEPTQSLRGEGRVLGTIALAGELRPAGLLQVDGDMVLAPEARWFVGIGGRHAADWDRLLVNGALDLNGEIVVSLRDDFSPALGDSFQLVDFGSLLSIGVTFRFDEAVLEEGLFWRTSDFASTGVITVIPGAPAKITVLRQPGPAGGRSKLSSVNSFNQAESA